MRFRFKSLLILSERERRVAGGTETTTVYDLSNIGEHTFDEPTWELWLSPFHLLATPLIASPVLGLALYATWIYTEGQLWNAPLLALAAVAAPLALFYPLSLHLIVHRHMKAQALRERLLADNIPITVVQEKEWESFRSRLKQTGPADQIALLREQLAQLKKNLQQPPLPLPNENALQKWDKPDSKAENAAENSDKVTEHGGFGKEKP